MFLLYPTGVIEVLVNSGRQIDAVNLAFAFELTEQFPPVPLLQSYLKEASKASSQIKPAQVYFSMLIISFFFPKFFSFLINKGYFPNFSIIDKHKS